VGAAPPQKLFSHRRLQLRLERVHNLRMRRVRFGVGPGVVGRTSGEIQRQGFASLTRFMIWDWRYVIQGFDTESGATGGSG